MVYKQDICPKCGIEMRIRFEDVREATKLGWATGVYLGEVVKILKCPKCGFEKVVRCRYEQYSVYDPIIVVCDDGTEYG